VSLQGVVRRQYGFRVLGVNPTTLSPSAKWLLEFRIFVCLYEVDSISAYSDNVFSPKTELYFAFRIFCEIEIESVGQLV
jgi:hypothetical protein